ncbi:MAG: DUF6402 family protein [Yersiniaceae bacterium]|nr:DUF6402 family protein [Yersiniaceae bacterium]
MTVATTITSTQKEKQEKKVEMDFFHIDMIPAAMEEMGWEVAPKLMRYWFSVSPAFSFDEGIKSKLLKMDAINMPPTQINTDIVKMSWAVKYRQVSDAIEELKGRWKSIKGISRLREQLQRVGDYENFCVRIGYSDDVRVLDATAQVNMLVIGSKTDEINDWFGAMGNSTLKLCVKGYTTIIEGKILFIAKSLGFYLKDTYDFVDDILPEPLGVWGKNRILSIEESIEYFKFFPFSRVFTDFVPVFNGDFRVWQKKHGTGGDFIILSDVLWFPIDGKEQVISL